MSSAAVVISALRVKRQSIMRLTQEPEIPGLVPWSGHLLLFLFLLIQEGQLSVIGENKILKKFLQEQRPHSKEVFMGHKVCSFSTG